MSRPHRAGDLNPSSCRIAHFLARSTTVTVVARYKKQLRRSLGSLDSGSIGIFNFGGSGNMSSNTVWLTNDAISSNHSSGVTFLNNVVTRGSTSVDARKNWWRNASGPSGWSIGSGDKVSANVQFFPWSTNATSTTFQACSISGTNSPETLNGTNGSDIICGKGGNDTLKGGAGLDSIQGGDGTDTCSDPNPFQFANCESGP